MSKPQSSEPTYEYGPWLTDDNNGWDHYDKALKALSPETYNLYLGWILGLAYSQGQMDVERLKLTIGKSDFDWAGDGKPFNFTAMLVVRNHWDDEGRILMFRCREAKVSHPHITMEYWELEMSSTETDDNPDFDKEEGWI